MIRYARKKQSVIIKACRLGDGGDMERELMRSGKIRALGGGRYEVFSQEAKDGAGEIARSGDYVKLDSDGNPYPNDKAFFEAKHVPAGDDAYRQITKPLRVWLADDGEDEVIDYLLATGRLTIDKDNPLQYFRAQLWGAPLSAPRDAVVVFYDVKRGEGGALEDVDFNFVVRGEFDKTYEWCDADH